MKKELAEDVYATLTGTIVEKYRVPGVENAFAHGSLCDREYDAMTRCRQRVWDRLGVEDDADVEGIIQAMHTIQWELCMKMFRLGLRFGREENDK